MGTERTRTMRMKSWGIDGSAASTLLARQGLQAVISISLHGGKTGAKIISVAKIPFICSACLLGWMGTQKQCWKVALCHGYYCSIIYFCFAGIAYALRNTILQLNVFW